MSGDETPTAARASPPTSTRVPDDDVRMDVVASALGVFAGAAHRCVDSAMDRRAILESLRPLARRLGEAAREAGLSPPLALKVFRFACAPVAALDEVAARELGGEAALGYYPLQSTIRPADVWASGAPDERARRGPGSR